MSQKLIVLRGLPASGKSWTAVQYVMKGFKRVNADDLRNSIDNGVYSKDGERYLFKIMSIMIKEALKDGYSVIYDNTNFNPYHIKTCRQIAEQLKVELEIIDIDTPLAVCLERDLQRSVGRVGKEVIMRMYNKWFKDGIFPPIPE